MCVWGICLIGRHLNWEHLASHPAMCHGSGLRINSIGRDGMMIFIIIITVLDREIGQLIVI